MRTFPQISLRPKIKGGARFRDLASLALSQRLETVVLILPMRSASSRSLFSNNENFFKDGDSPGTTGHTSSMATGRGTATGCGTLRTTTTTTAPPSSPASTGTGPSSLPGSILRLSTARVSELI